MKRQSLQARVLRSILKNPRRPVEIAQHLGADLREVFTALVTLSAWDYCEQMGECYWTLDADKVREFCAPSRRQSAATQEADEIAQRIVSASTTRAQILGPNSIFQLAAEAA